MGKETRFSDEFMAGLSLFASLGTLLCCALPALLIVLGLGAVVAGAVSNVPSLIWLSRNKMYVFAAAGILLVLAGIMRNRSAAKTCPVDPVKAKACGGLKRVSAWLYWIAVTLYFISIFVAYVLPLIV
jgi:hypothetical protein